MKFVKPINNHKFLLVFVHGLIGGEDTWLRKDGKSSILEYLSNDDQIRASFDVALFIYDSYLFNSFLKVKYIVKLFSKSKIQFTRNLSLRKISELFINELESDARDYDHIIVVSHSMGGLISKQAILDEIERSNHRKTTPRIGLYISLATPHSGAELATLGKLLLTSIQIKELSPTNEYLHELNKSWVQSKELPKRIYIRGLNDQIVPGGADAIDVDKSYPITSKDDHFSILVPTPGTKHVLNGIKDACIKFVEENGVDIGKAKHIEIPEVVSFSSKRKSWWLYVLLLIIIGGVAPVLCKTKKQVTSNHIDVIFTDSTYNVLLLPFQQVMDCSYINTEIEDKIISIIKDMNYFDSLNIDILLDSTDCIHTFDEAEEIGKSKNADLVIWGDYYENCTNNSASVKYYNLNANKDIPGLQVAGISKIEPIMTGFSSEYGTLLRDVNIIIYWIACYRSMENNDFDKAIKYLNKIPLDEELESAVSSEKALCYTILKDTTNAIRQFDLALKVEPNNERYLMNYTSLLLSSSHRFQFTDSIFKRLTELNPKNDNSQYNYGIFLMRYNKIDEANTHFNVSIKLNPYDVIHNIYYAKFLAKYYEDFPAASTHYLYAIQLDPKNANSHLEYGIYLQYKLCDMQAAEKHFMEAIRLEPTSAESYFVYGLLCFYEYQDKNKALNLFLNSYKLDSSNSELCLFLAKTYQLYTTYMDSADYYYNKALIIDSTNEKIIYNYACYLWASKNEQDKSLHFFNKLFSGANVNLEYLTMYGDLMRILRKDFIAAENAYLKVLSLNSNSEQAMSGLGILYCLKLNKPKLGRKYFEKAIKVNNENAMTHYYYSYILQKVFKDESGANEHYLEAIKLKPELKGSNIIPSI